MPYVPPMLTAHGRPQYYEIYKYKEVIGVSLMFMFVDMMGGVFSDLSLAFKEHFDVVAGVAYSLVVVCLFADQCYLARDNADLSCS